MAWRPGQDVVLSGHEASSHYCCLFPHNLVWKNAEGWHLREAVPAPGAGRAQLGPCVTVWPSFQPPVGGHGLVLESYGLNARTGPLASFPLKVAWKWS